MFLLSTSLLVSVFTCHPRLKPAARNISSDLTLDKEGIQHAGKPIKGFLLFHHLQDRRPHKDETVISGSNFWGPADNVCG